MIPHRNESNVPSRLDDEELGLNDLPDAQGMGEESLGAMDDLGEPAPDDLGAEGLGGEGLGAEGLGAEGLGEEGLGAEEDGSTTEELTHKIIGMIKDSGEDVDEVLALMAQLTNEENIDEIDTHSGLDMMDEVGALGGDELGDDELSDDNGLEELGALDDTEEDIGTRSRVDLDSDEITENDLPI